jgi:hypothetical protein
VERQWQAAQEAIPEPGESTQSPLLFAGGVDTDDDRATLPEEELQAEEETQIEAATRETTPPGKEAFASEKRLLDQMPECTS